MRDVLHLGMCVCKKMGARARTGSIGAARPKPQWHRKPNCVALSFPRGNPGLCRACRAGTSTGERKKEKKKEREREECELDRSQPRRAVRSKVSARSSTSHTRSPRRSTAYHGLPPRSGCNLAGAAEFVLVNLLQRTDEAAVPIALRDVLRVVIGGLHRLRRWRLRV